MPFEASNIYINFFSTTGCSIKCRVQFPQNSKPKVKKIQLEDEDLEDNLWSEEDRKTPMRKLHAMMEKEYEENRKFRIKLGV